MNEGRKSLIELFVSTEVVEAPVAWTWNQPIGSAGPLLSVLFLVELQYPLAGAEHSTTAPVYHIHRDLDPTQSSSRTTA
jgi:hypothetical protein